MGFPALKSVKKEFSKDDYGHLLTYIEDNCKYVKEKCRGIRETMMPKWVRIYRGVPNDKNKTWPWPGASNLVIQLAGTYSDELLSRVMAMYTIEPLFNCGVLGDFDDQTNLSGDDQGQEIEKFMQDISYEPEELDLYRVEETGFSSAIRYGTGVFKFPWEYVTEKQAVYIGGGTQDGDTVNYSWKEHIRRDGPHPAVVSLADWSIDPKFTNVNKANFKVHTLHMSGYELKKWEGKPEIYNPEALKRVLAQPDAVPEYRRQLEEQKEIETSSIDKCADQYDIEECWLEYFKGFDHDGRPEIYRIIAYYHIATDIHIGEIFNVYPENIEPFEDAKLAYDDEMYFGYGFCEMLEAYQREVSETHNWRVDNRRFATTGVGRVNKNSKLSSIVQLFPGVLIPADEGEVEPLAFGQNAANYGTEDESMTISLATTRAGVDPATGGSGGGTVNPKKGTFSAQGTAMSLQSQNNRNNLRMSDMRSCHVRMGRKLLKMYAYFGLGNKIRKYGDRADALRTALDNIKTGRLGLLIQPSTASLNVEMEKQNDILLSATLERLYAADLQAMQILQQPGIAGTPIEDLVRKQFRAKNALMKSLLRAFGKRDYNRLLAVPQFMLDERKQNAGSQGNNAGPSTAAILAQGQNQGMVPFGNGQGGGGIPAGVTQ